MLCLYSGFVSALDVVKVGVITRCGIITEIVVLATDGNTYKAPYKALLEEDKVLIEKGVKKGVVTVFEIANPKNCI